MHVSDRPVRRRLAFVVTCAAATVLVAACSSTSSPTTSASPSGGGGVPSFNLDAATPKATSTYNKWAWFPGTYWIVPEDGIYSVAHSGTQPNQFNVVRGQTVFNITDYFNGYFTGIVVVKLTGAQQTACQYVLGQVTPQGNVLMTMYDTQDGTVINQPTGTMVQQNGAWTMVNTMTSPTQNGGTLSHWAYMLQSKPGDASYTSLPFVDQSVPDFMSACPAGPTISGS